MVTFVSGDKLAVWTADARNAENNLKIGRTLKQRLNIPKTVSIGFQVKSLNINGFVSKIQSRKKTVSPFGGNNQF